MNLMLLCMCMYFKGPKNFKNVDTKARFVAHSPTQQLYM